MDERAKARTRQLEILKQMQALIRRLKIELRTDYKLLSEATSLESTLGQLIASLQPQAEGAVLAS